ncbi:MAG: hypothetical protein AAGE89_15590 [Pseudomonadota bacterium]
MRTGADKSTDGNAPVVTHDEADFGPWNPGLEASIPREVLPLSTMFRSDNVLLSFSEIEELAAFVGLPAFDLAPFRAERLAAHEVLVRVTADLSLRDGPNYADLGISLRGMVTKILDDYVLPDSERLAERLADFTEEAQNRALADLDAALYAHPQALGETSKASSFFARLFTPGSKKAAKRIVSDAERVAAAMTEWSVPSERKQDDKTMSHRSHLIRAVNAFFAKNGRIGGGREAIARAAAILTANEAGSILIADEIAPLIAKAIEQKGYRVLPPQEEPVIMNVKGASASGKSTARVLQRELAERLRLPWADFALISPDYWRKFLIDYEGLGPHYKYGGMLSGHELAIIDRKLDRHMAEKAKRGEISHLLIDRFRFDSFSTQTDGNEAPLLTRFGSLVFLFFMITPPEATVERAWKRGKKTGRYKAVEDLLYHNVEAYTGMPKLFFAWALDNRRRVHFEFLDNSVPKGQRPKTVAHGWNAEMTVLDINGLFNIERFRAINIRAESPEAVYQGQVQDAPRPGTFLKTCVERFDSVRFVDPQSGQLLGETRKGVWHCADIQAISRRPCGPDLLELLSPPGNLKDCRDMVKIRDEEEIIYTVGDWSVQK